MSCIVMGSRASTTVLLHWPLCPAAVLAIVEKGEIYSLLAGEAGVGKQYWKYNSEAEIQNETERVRQHMSHCSK